MHVFTYGTLMFPKVWQTVVGREFEHVPAVLPGYQIFRIAGEVYPGIIAANSSPSGRGQVREHSSLPTSPRPLPPSVPGLVYLNLDPAPLARLDQFEDDFYRRQTVAVTAADGRELEAQAYVVPPASAHRLTDEIWTATEFAARGHLAEFTARYSGFGRLD